MQFKQRVFKVFLVMLCLVLFLHIHSIASASAGLKLESVYPTLGEMGQDLDVTLTGTGFDENTRVSMSVDVLNIRAVIGSVVTPGFAHDVFIAGDKAYVADMGSGLQVIDISNPESPQIIGSVDTPGPASGVAIAGDKAYVADGDAGLVVVPLPVEISPITVDSPTSISLSLPSPQMVGHYNLRVFNGNESDELIGAIAFQSSNQPGDVDGDGNVDVTDVIVALKALSGMDTTGLLRSDYVTSGADVNGDNKIGLAEILYIMRGVADGVASPDNDGDGVADGEDNCPSDANSDQLDTDGDDQGDVCDTDDDEDEVDDAQDNCPLDMNADQLDTDGDSVGDVCDNCPFDTNADQFDTDSDGEGDVCDPSESLDDIALAIFKYQVSNQGKADQTYRFLQLDGQDPKPEIINEFADSEYIVKPVSESEWAAEEGEWCAVVVDKESGLPGTIFEVEDDVIWESDTTITVFGGLVMECLWAEWGRYSLEWIDNEWVVQDFIAEYTA